MATDVRRKAEGGRRKWGAVAVEAVTSAVETAPGGDGPAAAGAPRHETALRRLGTPPSPAHGGGSPPQRRGGGISLRLTPYALRLTFALILALLLALIPTLVAADELDDRVRAIAKELRCPVCAGETVADSNAQVSIQMRGIIREKLEAGETPEQIKAYFVERYGESVLLSPETSGFTLGVWIMPVVALLLGLVIVFTVIRSWSRRGAPVIATTPAAPPASALPPDDDERLEEELARFRRTRGGVRG